MKTKTNVCILDSLGGVFLKLHTTLLEDWVTRLYQSLKIYHPTQIDIQEIARMVDICLRFETAEPYHYVSGDFRAIIIDSRIPFQEQREQFFHELCHILLHSGIQSTLPDTFRNLQERDAKNFTLYALTPYHMLRFIDFRNGKVINEMSLLFQAPIYLCERRLTQIKDRLLVTYGNCHYITENIFSE